MASGTDFIRESSTFPGLDVQPFQDHTRCPVFGRPLLDEPIAGLLRGSGSLDPAVVENRLPILP